MKTTRLTTKFVETVKPTPGKQVAYPDAQIAGLELRVSPQGRKVWSLRYRTQAGKQRRLSLGVFPAVDLGDARDKAIQALGAVSEGSDPASDKRRAAHEAKNLKIRTFNDLADAYVEACEAGEWKPKGKKKRERTLKDEKSILKRNIRPTMASWNWKRLTARR